MICVLFVCHGNICRSPMAEFVLRHMVKARGLEGKITVASAATSSEELGSDVHRGTRRKLQEQGIAFSHRQARLITARDYREFDYLIGMDSRNLSNMRRVGGVPDGKVSRLLAFAGLDRDIADPWYTGNFDETYDDICQGCTALLDCLEKQLQG